MELHLLSFVRLNDEQIDLLHHASPGCTVVCGRPEQTASVMPDVDILLGYDSQMDIDTFL